MGANLFVVALLVAALALPGLGTQDALPRTATARVPTPPGAWIVAAVLFLLPLGFAGSDLHTSVQVPALGVVLLSLVVVTGRGGQISLGQAAYAGLGALFTALLAAGRFPGLPELPHLPALAVAVLLVAPLGLLTGWPAISRHGLALALATFAVGVGVSRFVFTQPYATSGLTLGRPAGFAGDRAYYLLELALLGGAVLLGHALRRGRTGRALAAMRDHEAGAAAAGVPVPALKLAPSSPGPRWPASAAACSAWAYGPSTPGRTTPCGASSGSRPSWSSARTAPWAPGRGGPPGRPGRGGARRGRGRPDRPTGGPDRPLPRRPVRGAAPRPTRSRFRPHPAPHARGRSGPRPRGRRPAADRGTPPTRTESRRCTDPAHTCAGLAVPAGAHHGTPEATP